MRLTLWDPFKELTAMQKALESTYGTARQTYPPIEIIEKEDSIQVSAALPGIDKNTLELTILGDTLTIAGEKKLPIENIAYIRHERPYGKFHKLVDLPCAVEQDKVTATYNNGILAVTMPKAETIKPRQIKVE